MNTYTLPLGGRRAASKPRRCRVLFPLFLAGIGIGLAGCSSDPTPAAPPGCIPGESFFTYRLPFHLEYRTPGEMTFSSCFDDLEGTLVLAEDYAFLEAGRAYPAVGKRRTLPESAHVLYTWEIPVPDVDSAVCAQGNATVSLTFSARDSWQTFTGGFAVYCGPQTAAGRVHQVLRVTGVLERTELP